MDVLLAAIEILLTNPSGHQEHLINVNEEKPDPSPPSCDHPSVFGVCVELKKDDDKVEEASDMGSVNQDSTVLTEREEPGVPKHEQTTPSAHASQSKIKKYKRHLSTTSNSHTPNSTMAKTKELSKDTRNKIVDLHQAGKTESAIAPQGCRG